MSATLDIGFPLAIGPDGRMRRSATPRHIDEMIAQLIFTNPGERVNRPEFGGGMYQVIFAPNSVELQATVHFTLLAALQQYLGDLIDILNLDIAIDGETFSLTLGYRILRTGETVTTQLGPFAPGVMP